MDDYFKTPAPADKSLLKEFLSNSKTNRSFDKEHYGDYSTFHLLNKASVIHSIGEQTAGGSIPEGILDSLQIIQLLDLEQGIPVSDSMRAAFCAVAVHCTLTALPLSWSCYFDAVQRIWRFRIRNIEDSLNNQLICPDLAKWRDDIEAALWDSETSQRLLRIDTLCEALKRIRVYVAEARSSMKPAVLRFTVDHTAPAQTPSRPHSCTDKEKRILEVDHQTKYNLRASQRRPYSSLSTPEVKKIQEALKSSTADLLAVVTDPLHKALEVAERVEKELHAKAVGEDVNKDTNQNNVFRPSRMEMNGTARTYEVAERVEKDLHTKAVGEVAERVEKDSHAKAVREDVNKDPNQNNVLRPSIMERNGTARTYKWEDSIDGTFEGTSSSNRCHLPSPKIKPVSPLKKHINPKWARRRKINRWSVEEENALAEGVHKYGTQWKLILISYPDTFTNRSTVDLKDKWRNMSGK